MISLLLILLAMICDLYFLGKCPKCKRFSISTKRVYIGTSYNDPESNFMILCSECQKEILSIVKDMWNDYYSSQGFGIYESDRKK